MSKYDPEKYRVYYKANKERKLEQVMDYQKNRRDPIKRNAYERQRYAEIKKQVIEHYGGECACCGEKEPEFLQIDHVNGGGNEHRRQIEKKYGGKVAMTKWIWTNNYPEGFQLLCANCNTAKGIYGRCPHEKLAESAEMTDRLIEDKVHKQQIVGGYGRVSENRLIRGEYSSSLDNI